MTSAFARIGAVVAATALALISAAVPAHAVPKAAEKKYAALGDSYSAGVGTGLPDPTAGICFRSPAGYPNLIANATGWELDYLACLGAQVPDIVNTQVPQIDSDTDVITMTAGGNDVGFFQILFECAAVTPDPTRCAWAIAQGNAALDTVLPIALTNLYQAVRTRAETADIVVVGYPRLFRRTDCLTVPGAAEITRTEAALMNAFADRLNAVIEQAARNEGFKYAEAIPSFKGNDVCATRPWINGFLDQSRFLEQFHPNVAGNAGYARLVARELGVTGPVARATAHIR